MVTLEVGDQNTDFMVDTGAELSVVKPMAPLSKKTIAVTGVSGEDLINRFASPENVRWGGTK